MSITYHRHMVTMAEGTASTQRQIRDDESAGRLFKSFAPACIPGQYQTLAYATTRLTEACAWLGLPAGGVEETAKLRMARAELLNDSDRKFEAVVAEWVLYGASADPDVMVEQLQHLLLLAAKPNVRLGILPINARVEATAMSHFDIIDDSRVSVETMAVTYHLEEAPEVDMYLRIFDTFAEAAVFGEGARALINGALAEFRRSEGL